MTVLEVFFDTAGGDFFSCVAQGLIILMRT